MPFTAFHPVPVWLLCMRYPRRFDFIALTVGAVVPDLFEPFVLLGFIGPEWGHRNWTHSLLGALTLDAGLALAGTVLVARPLLGWADRRWPSGLWSHFAGLELAASRRWSVTLVSAWIGSLAHILVDVPAHSTLRLFFPAFTLILFPPELDTLLHLSADLVFGPLSVYILYVYWWRPSRRHPDTRGAQNGTK